MTTSRSLMISLSLLPVVSFAAKPTPVHFPRWNRPAVLFGELSHKHPEHVYSLSGRRGGHLMIDLQGLGGDHGIVPMYHIVFPSGKTFGEKGYDPFDGHLTENGQYRIYVEVNQMASNGTHGRYRLTLRR